MRTNDTNEKSEGNHEKSERVFNAQNVATAAASNPLSRRSFFGRVGASTAVAAATGVGLPLLSEKAQADDGDADADDPSSRRGRSYQIRHKAAIEERKIPTPRQISNGDEARYPNFIGNFSQELPAPRQHR